MHSMGKKDKARQEFAARFRQALAKLGFSPNEAKRMRQQFGVSGQAVQKWVEGQALPMAARIPEIAEILGIRRTWLQDGEEPQPVTEAAVAERAEVYGNAKSNLVLTAGEAKLLAQFRLLDEEQRKLVTELLV